MELSVPQFEPQREILLELQKLCEQKRTLDERIEKADSMHPAIKKKYINTYNNLILERNPLETRIKELRAKFTRWVMDESPTLKAVNESIYNMIRGMICNLPAPADDEQKKRAKAVTVIFYEAAILDAPEIIGDTCRLLKEKYKHGV